MRFDTIAQENYRDQQNQVKSSPLLRVMLMELGCQIMYVGTTCPENCSVGRASVSRAFLNATVSRAATESWARRPEKKVQEKFLSRRRKYPNEANNENTVAEQT